MRQRGLSRGDGEREKERDAAIQILFDVKLLRVVLDHGEEGKEEEKGLSELEKRVKSELGTGEWERIGKSVGEWWRRSGVLFGPLA